VRHHIVIIFACLASLAAGGCGGGGDASAPAVGAAFAAKATALCQTAAAEKRKQGSFPDADFDPRQPDIAKLPAVAAFIAEGGAIYATWLRAMQALGAPPSGSDAWAQLLAQIAVQRQLHEHQQAAALRGDTAAFTADFERGQTSVTDLRHAADAAGLPACGKVAI
jgi:hypothetical protein